MESVKATYLHISSRIRLLRHEEDVPFDRFDSEDDAESALSSEPFIAKLEGQTRSRSRSRSPTPYRLGLGRRRTLAFLSTFLFSLFVIGGLFLSDSHISKSEANSTHYVAEAFGTNSMFVASRGSDSAFLPRVPKYNIYKSDTLRPRTPLLIGFTRNYKMLEQTVLGYISAGWPRRDIIVVDNSGTMNANKRKLLSKSNPFFLDYEKLTTRYGVNIFRTPTLLSFAQLQNFIISTALEYGWEYYYWSHMDIMILGHEEETPYKSVYEKIVEDLEAHLGWWNQTEKLGSRENIRRRGISMKYPQGVSVTDWGHRYYGGEDWLALVNTAAMEKVGAWDNFIPYYTTDCDFQGRMKMSGLEVSEGDIGKIFDVGTQIPNAEHTLFGSKNGNGEPEEPGSKRYHELKRKLEEMQKYKREHWRNFWQNEQKGGKGEPWTYDPEGFQTGWWAMNEYGRQVYNKKWKLQNGGSGGCKLIEQGKSLEDAWSP